MPLDPSFWIEAPEPPRPVMPRPLIGIDPGLDGVTGMSMGCKVPYSPNPCGEIPGPASKPMSLQTMWDPKPGGWPKGKPIIDQMQQYLDQKLKPQTVFMSEVAFNDLKAFDFETNALHSDLIVMDSITSPGTKYLEQKVMEHIRKPTTTAADKRLYALLLGATRAS